MNIVNYLLENQKVVYVADEEDMGFGFYPNERPPEMYIRFGVINLDKPPGPTSHQVTTWVKNILEVSKAGHGGTLDPMVTGVLPIGIEKATAAMRYIVGSSKEYVGVIHLHADADIDDILTVFSMFKGRIYQRPPQRSSVRRKLRTRTIYELEVLEVENRDVLFRVYCESGFYVRKLAHDIGLILGVEAHLSELRRIKAGPFDEKTIVDMYTLYAAAYEWKENEEFKYLKKVIQPVEVIFKSFPKIIVKDTAIASITYGASLKAPGVLGFTDDVKKDMRVALISKKGELISVAISLYNADELDRVDKGVIAVSERVFMDRDLYPPMWKKKV